MALNVTLSKGAVIQQVTVGGIALPAFVITPVGGAPTALAYNAGDGIVFTHTIKDGTVSATGRELDAEQALNALVGLAG